MPDLDFDKGEGVVVKDQTVKIKCVIEGVNPMLVNRFTDEAQAEATNGTRPSTVGKRATPKEDAKSRLYLNNKGESIMPSVNLIQMFTSAGTYFKVGKSKLTTQKSSLIPACLSIEELEPVIKSKDGWTVDSRPIRIPSTGGRIVRHRPKFNDWCITFTLVLDTEIMDDKVLRDLVDCAGKRIGCGDFRPQCKGPFGKFVVTLWKVL
jgi:hypothetical protein